jgi:hypothetical protein
MDLFGREAAPTPPNELPIPGDAFDKDSNEIFRAWIVEGGLQVSLQRGFDDPAAWGILLVDVARHVSRIYAAEGAMSQADALARIKSLFDAEWASSTDDSRTMAARQ